MADSTSHSTPHFVDPTEPDPDFIRWVKENCVPIVGVVSAGLGLCLVAHYGSTTVDWTRTKDLTEAFTNVIQSLALIAGGVWAYFKFAKGRTFQDRLTPSVSGRFVSIDGAVYLIVIFQLENVGLSRIAFDQKASSLFVFEYVASEVEEILRVKNDELASFQVFGDTDRYIEPNEITGRQTLIALPRVSKIGYQLELKVFSDSGYTWRATTIVEGVAFEDNAVD